MEAFLFYISAALAIGGGLAVAFNRNIVRSGFSLLATLLGLSFFYLLLGADFLFGVQMLVYVGGILVLVLFAVLLTTRIDQVRFSNPSMTGLPAAVLVGFTAATLGLIAVRTAWPEKSSPIVKGFVDHVTPIGDQLLTRWLFPFEAISILLLVALIGAVYLARKELRGGPAIVVEPSYETEPVPIVTAVPAHDHH